jgi:hypothetical protein
MIDALDHARDRAGYLIAPELTATGFEANEGANHRNERASEAGR